MEYNSDSDSPDEHGGPVVDVGDDASSTDEEGKDASSTDEEGNKEMGIRAQSMISVASSGFGAKEPSVDENKTEKKEVRGKAMGWVTEVEFDSMVDFDESPALKDLLDNYNLDNKKVNKAGDVIRTFVCKFSKKKRGFACPAKSKTVFSGAKMTVLRLDKAHKHEVANDSVRKNFNFIPEVEAKMRELVELNVKSRNIRKHLIEKGFFTEETAPSDQIFYSKTSNLRKKLNLDRKQINLQEFEDLIKQNSVVPEDPTEPYIVKSKVEEDDNGKLRYSVMFSSKKLIETYMKPGKNWVFSVDATYQTNTEDCPLIFFGSSAKNGKFNGIGAILSNREDKIAYSFMFDFVKQEAEPLPTAVMADADRAITSSVKDNLPQTIRLTCFFHVMKNVKQKLTKVKSVDAAVYKKIIDDIRVLQTSAVDKESFFTLYKLLENKWLNEHTFFDPELKDLVAKFLDYFSRIWVKSDEANWYQAANPQHVTTNNNVEGTNFAFKRDYTGRTRLSFPNMFQKLLELLKTWGRTNAEQDFDPEKVPVNILIAAEEIIQKCKEKKLLLSKPSKKSHRKIVKESNAAVAGYVQEVCIIPRKAELFYKSREEFASVGQNIHKRRNTIGYKTFEEFKQDSEDIAIVELVFEDENKQGKSFFACNCDCGPKLPAGCKGKVCVHVVVALIELGIIKKKAEDRKLSGFHHKKGKGKKNAKQNA